MVLTCCENYYISKHCIPRVSVIDREVDGIFLFLLSDRSQLDAQISTEDTFSTVSTNGRQQSSHNRASEGGAQDVRIPRGDFHRGDCLPESIGECTRTRACALESGENETERKINGTSAIYRSYRSR